MSRKALVGSIACAIAIGLALLWFFADYFRMTQERCYTELCAGEQVCLHFHGGYVLIEAAKVDGLTIRDATMRWYDKRGDYLHVQTAKELRIKISADERHSLLFLEHTTINTPDGVEIYLESRIQELRKPASLVERLIATFK